jgi:hypothetical protein
MSMVQDRDDSKWEAYLALLTEVFSKYGFENSITEWNTDPWSPHDHYIVRREKRKFLGFIPDSKLITVAKIEIEPQFSLGQLNYSKRGSTPKIRIIDNACVDAVNEFCKKYKKTFGQEWKIE